MKLFAGSETIRRRIGAGAAGTIREGFSETVLSQVAEGRVAYIELSNDRGMTAAAMTSKQPTLWSSTERG